MKNLYLKINQNKIKIFIVFIIFLVLLITFLILTVKLKQIYDTYQKATFFKEYYEIIESELKYCHSIQNTSQPRDNFVYCDRLLNKFNSLEEKNKSWQ